MCNNVLTFHHQALGVYFGIQIFITEAELIRSDDSDKNRDFYDSYINSGVSLAIDHKCNLSYPGSIIETLPGKLRHSVAALASSLDLSQLRSFLSTRLSSHTKRIARGAPAGLRPCGGFRSVLRLTSYVDQCMLHVTDTKVAGSHGEVFIPQTHNFEELD